MAYDLAASGDVMQMGYGGEPHGGKTDLALGLAGTVFPDTKIFRRTFNALNKMIERGNKIFPTSYISGRKSHWRFDNHLIELAHMQHEKHWKTHQGQPSSLMVFDEAAQFHEVMVRTVGGWLRTTVEGQHTLLLLCFNPPTDSEGEWIVQFFAPWIDPDYPGEPAQPGEIRWFAYMDGKDVEVPNGEPIQHNDLTLYPVSRTFIPASRYDNPYHTVEYEQALSALPEPLRTMMMNADYSVRAQDNDWQAIPTVWILKAMERGRKTPKPDLKLRAIGCDPSRGGDDETAIAKLYGSWFAPIIAYPGSEMVDGPTVGKKVIEHMETIAPIFIDETGVGTSPYDYLKELPNVDVTPIVNSEGTNETDKNGILGFANVRAASYWKLKEALDPASGQEICLPDNRLLRVDLSAPRYKVVGGRIVIEKKEDIVKRTRRSPDYGDAVVMAWYGVNKPIPSIDWI